MATRRAWFEAHERGYDFILNLQNDFPCIRACPFDDIFGFLDANQDVGFVQLNDKGILMYPRKDGTFKTKKKPRKKNLVTGKAIKYKKWQVHGSTQFAKGNYHFNFNPNLFRAELVPHLVTDTNKPRERHIMEKFNETGLRCARVRHRIFETIIRKRERSWLH